MPTEVDPISRKTPDKNWALLQGEMFRLCHARASRAIKSGFYLEAIVLSESLILNRIEAVLSYSAGVSYDRFSVGKALRNVESHEVTVFEETTVWRSRLGEAKLTAIAGIELANRWSKESRKHKL